LEPAKGEKVFLQLCTYPFWSIAGPSPYICDQPGELPVEIKKSFQLQSERMFGNELDDLSCAIQAIKSDCTKKDSRRGLYLEQFFQTGYVILHSSESEGRVERSRETISVCAEYFSFSEAMDDEIREL
jgi:hypothetical protein